MALDGVGSVGKTLAGLDDVGIESALSQIPDVLELGGLVFEYLDKPVYKNLFLSIFSILTLLYCGYLHLQLHRFKKEVGWFKLLKDAWKAKKAFLP